VARLRADLADVRGLAVAGAALDGIGIAACVGSAYAAVAKITADLAGRGGRIDP
jgi:protoporphyrinogen/coproporphyrinogen III oxidase